MRQTLDDIRRKLTDKVYKNEEHVRLSLVARILNELGWNLWNPVEVNCEFATVPNEDSTRVDIALFYTPYTPSTYIEIKSIGKLQGDISPYEVQLRDYNRNNTAVFTIMTDGRKWRFYFSQTGGEFSQKCFKILDLIEDDIDELELTFFAFLSKSEIGNGNAKREAESYLQLSQKQRAMEDVLAQAKKRTLEPPYPRLPEAIVELVAEKGLMVTVEETTQFIKKLDAQKSLSESKPIRHTVIVASPVLNIDVPKALAYVLEVSHEVLRNRKNYREATKIVTQRKSLKSPHTVPDACTRRIGINTDSFNQLLQNKEKLITHLLDYYSEHENYIRDALK